MAAPTCWQTVLQSQLCHPDWDARMHVAYLEGEEGLNLRALLDTNNPEAVITGWLLDNHHSLRLENAWSAAGVPMAPCGHVHPATAPCQQCKAPARR